MTFVFTVYTVVYGTAALISGLAIPFAWKRQAAPGGRWLLLMLVAMVEWASCIALEMSVVELQAHLFWSKVSYFGAMPISVFLLLFALEYAGKTHWLAPRIIAALFVVPVLGIVAVFLNDWHQLIWTGYARTPLGQNVLVYHHGPLYWAVTAYGVGIVLTAVVILMGVALRSRETYRRQSMGLVLAILVPLSAVFVYDIAPGALPGIDPALSFAATGAILTYTMWHYRLLDLVPISRESLLDAMIEGILVIDERKRVVDANAAAAEICEFSLGPLIGRDIRELLASWPELAEQLATALPDAQTSITLKSPTGRRISVQTSGVPVSNGTHGGILTVLVDVTAQKMAEEALQVANAHLRERIAEVEELHGELREQAVRDPLTTLFNRRYLAETLDREFGRALREGYPISFVMMDIDYFKKVNDDNGHTAGDRLLRLLGSQLRAQIRPGDMACRYGGDEFLLVLPNTSVEDAARRANEWRIALKNSHVMYQGVRIAATVSLGVAGMPDHGVASDEVLQAADQAVYAAKAAGRDRVVTATGSAGLFVIADDA